MPEERLLLFNFSLEMMRSMGLTRELIEHFLGVGDRVGEEWIASHIWQSSLRVLGMVSGAREGLHTGDRGIREFVIIRLAYLLWRALHLLERRHTMQKRVPLIHLRKKSLHLRAAFIVDWEIDVLESQVVTIMGAVGIAVLLVHFSIQDPGECFK